MQHRTHLKDVKKSNMEKGAMQIALEWGAKLGAEIAKDMKDNKIDFMEGLGFWDNALGLIPIIKKIGEFPEDWKRLNSDEAYLNQIVLGVSSELTIENGKSKEIVLQGLRAGLETAKFVNMFTNLK